MANDFGAFNELSDGTTLDDSTSDKKDNKGEKSPYNATVLKYPLDNNIVTARILFTAYEYQFIDFSSTEVADVQNKGKFGSVDLYLPGGFSENYNINYGDEELSAMAALAHGHVGSTMKLTSLKIAQFAQKHVSGFDQASGYTLIPNTIKMFKGTEFISQNFTFNLVPKNQKEAEVINKIVDFFKRTALPVQKPGTKSQMFLKFPALFSAKAYKVIKNDGNTKTAKVKNNVIVEYKFLGLNNIGISYSPNTSSVILNHDGNPVQINLTLSFVGLYPPRIVGDRFGGKII